MTQTTMHSLHKPLKRRHRRLLVTMEMILISLTVVAGILLEPDLSMPALLGRLVLPILAAVCHTRLALSIQNIAQVNPRILDERQRATRDRAFSLSLVILSVVLSVIWGYAMIASYAGWWLPMGGQLWQVLWLPAMLSYGLPTAIAAWLEPDALEDEALMRPG